MASNLKDLFLERFVSAELTKRMKSFAKSKEAKMLSGYKTYIVAGVLLLVAALKFIGIEVPGVSENSDPGALVSMAIGLVFSRMGAKSDVTKALK